MDYCSGVWGFKKSDTCNKVPQRALRYLLGVHSKTPILALEGDTGWLNTEVRRHTEMFRFWNCIIKMDVSRRTRKVFETDYRICKNNWCSEIKQLFEKVNKIDIYHNIHVINMKYKIVFITYLQING